MPVPPQTWPIPLPGRGPPDGPYVVLWIVQVTLGIVPPVRAIRRFIVRPVLPAPLEALGELAGNLRWSWHPETQDLFADADPAAWEASGHDPVRMLGAVSMRRLQHLAADDAFLQRLAAARADLEHYLTGYRWYQRHAGRSTPGGAPRAAGQNGGSTGGEAPRVM